MIVAWTGKRVPMLTLLAIVLRAAKRET